MLDIEKIRLMSQLEMFYQREGKNLRECGHYFKSDYIARKLFSTFLHFTLAFILLLALYAMISFNHIISAISLNYVKKSGMTLLFLYLFGLIVVLIVSALVMSERYDSNYRKQLQYAARLNKLLAMDEEQTAQTEDKPIESKRGNYRYLQERGVDMPHATRKSARRQLKAGPQQKKKRMER